MGMTGAQQFFRVELPLALPLVISGIRLALVQVWATATIAALVAGPGLGRVITDGFYRTNYGKGIAGAIVVAAVALVLELLAAQRPAAADRRRAVVTESRAEACRRRALCCRAADSGCQPDPDTRGRPAGHRR